MFDLLINNRAIKLHYEKMKVLGMKVNKTTAE